MAHHPFLNSNGRVWGIYEKSPKGILLPLVLLHFLRRSSACAGHLARDWFVQDATGGIVVGARVMLPNKAMGVALNWVAPSAGT
jgi:hypothetical protein